MNCRIPVRNALRVSEQGEAAESEQCVCIRARTLSVVMEWNPCSPPPPPPPPPHPPPSPGGYLRGMYRGCKEGLPAEDVGLMPKGCTAGTGEAAPEAAAGVDGLVAGTPVCMPLAELLETPFAMLSGRASAGPSRDGLGSAKQAGVRCNALPKSRMHPLQMADMPQSTGFP